MKEPSLLRLVEFSRSIRSRKNGELKEKKPQESNQIDKKSMESGQTSRAQHQKKRGAPASPPPRVPSPHAQAVLQKWRVQVGNTNVDWASCMDLALRRMHRVHSIYQKNTRLLFDDTGEMRLLREALDAAERGSASEWTFYMRSMRERYDQYMKMPLPPPSLPDDFDRKQAFLLSQDAQYDAILPRKKDVAALVEWIAGILRDSEMPQDDTKDMTAWALQTRGSFPRLGVLAPAVRERYGMERMDSNGDHGNQPQHPTGSV